MIKYDDPLDEVRTMIKTELRLRKISYRNLSERLALQGVNENESQIKAKINRGTFSFLFFVQTMRAIDAEIFDFRRYREQINPINRRDSSLYE